MTKDLFEDYKRYQSDREENNRLVNVHDQEKFVKGKCEQLRVGNIVKIMENEYLPADLVILNTSEKKGVCFIETKNLDGETNLKQK